MKTTFRNNTILKEASVLLIIALLLLTPLVVSSQPIQRNKKENNTITWLSSAKTKIVETEERSNLFKQEEIFPSEITWIHYDNGENYDAIGHTNNVTWEWAIRLTPFELSPYNDCYLTTVRFYHGYPNGPIVTHSGYIKIYDNGTESLPGSEIISARTPWSHTSNNWVNITLLSPVEIDASKDLWVSVECVDQEPMTYPAGIDPGPAVDGKGDWIHISSVPGEWLEIQDIGFNNNWNLWAGIECEPQPPCCFEVNATYILNTVQQGVHITVKNICDEMQYEVPWNLTITGGLVLNVNGRFKDGLIQNLKPGDELKLKHKVIGLGNIHIIVNVDDCPPFEFDAFLIGPFTIRQETENKYHSCGC